MPAELALQALVAGHAGDEAAADRLYVDLRRYGDATVVGPDGVSWGPGAYYLGLVAGAAGRIDEAVMHLESARARAAEAGTLPWLAAATQELGRVLLRRGGAEDRARAAELLLEGVAVLHEAGARRFGSMAAAHLKSLEPGASRDPEIGRLPGAGDAVLREEGEYWTISYRSGVFRLRGRKGLVYLRVLLRRGGSEVHVLDLVRAEAGRRPRGPDARAEGLSVAGTVQQDLVDPRARSAYRERLTELQDELSEAESWGDEVRATQARSEIDAIASHLSRAMGLAGRPRRMRDEVERARVNVTRHVRSAIAAIEEHDEVLGAHLRSTVVTGTFCAYMPGPDDEISWAF